MQRPFAQFTLSDANGLRVTNTVSSPPSLGDVKSLLQLSRRLPAGLGLPVN